MPTVHRLDMRGRACPEPVVETRKALNLPDAGKLQVLVDNPDSAENVKRMATSMGFSCEVEQDDSGAYAVAITKNEHSDAGCETCQAPPRVVVLIASSRFGEGAAELGDLLMRSLIKTIKQLDPLPEGVVFVNSGVEHTTEGSVLIDDIRELEELGAEILSCGTCLDYYHLKDKLRVGQVSNMYEILSMLASADRLVRA